MGEANFNERFLDPVTRWKLLLSQIELSRNKKSPRMKWKIGATKSRYVFFYDLTTIYIKYHFTMKLKEAGLQALG